VSRPEVQGFNFTLKDVEYETEKLVKGRVFADGRGIYIQFEKYGTKYDQIPVLIEQINGIPVVRVWSDYKQDDATHNIDIKAAKLPKGHA